LEPVGVPGGVDTSFKRVSQKQNILDSIQQKREDLAKLRLINAIESTGIEGNLFDNIFHSRDRDMICEEISVQEDVLNMVESTITDIMVVEQGSVYI
jgi:hypothetical protein